MKDDQQSNHLDDQKPASGTNKDEECNVSKGRARDENQSAPSDQAQREQDRAIISGDENPS